MHHAAVTEAHLMLGRVHVDIHHRRVQLEKEYEGRVPAVEQHVPVGLAHRMGDQLVTDHPAIDAEILQIRLTAGKGRQPHPAPEPQTAALLVDGHRLLDEGGTADAGHPAPGFLLGMCRSQAEYGTAVVTQIEGHIEARQCQALDHLLEVAELGFLGTQKLAPCRRVEEQVAHFDRGALRVGSRLNPGVHVAPLGLDLPGLICVFGTGGQQQARYRADRGQRLAAKAQGGHPLQIIQIGNLAGGMARQGQRQILMGDAATIIAHPQQLHAALLDIDINASSAGIQAVFQQLLDDRGRPFHHFTGGDLVGQPRRQQMYSGHLQPHDRIRGHFSPTCWRPVP